LAANQLHLIVLSRDPEVRQIVGALDPDVWRVDVVDAGPGIFSQLTHDTRALIVDEAADAGYVALIRRARKTTPVVDTLVVGGPKSDEVQRAERAEGVDYYFERPLEPRAFDAALHHRLAITALKARGGIVGRSPAMEEVLEAVLQVAPTEVPILIEGESGTGKDVIARVIHGASRRGDREFEAVNCGALAEGVLESELFGHEKGAFTGAVARRAGMFERADGGTIFLDEVGETSPNMQVRLLRVIETGEVMRVGGVGSFQVDVRIVAATNRNLAEAVQAGRFRQDLYYRLKGVNLRLPSLRQRTEDIPLLVHHFILQANRRHHKSVRGVEASALRRLEEHDWPGNIRELRNVVDTLVVLCPGARITSSLVEGQLAGAGEATSGGPAGTLLPVPLNRPRDEAEREMIYASILALHRDIREVLHLLREGRPGGPPGSGLREVPLEAEEVDGGSDITLSQLERAAIQEALNRSAGNRRQAADALGISERTLYRKIKEYGLV
jgi:DNA-binding NtrC family response regulator